MGRILCLKPRINKNNGQINFSLPKKKIPKSIRDNPDKIKNIKIRLEDWSLW
jgi:hypothetical protein